jgi:predicted transcriptional regulator
MTSVVIDQESSLTEYTTGRPQPRPFLGRLEADVMRVLWRLGECSVQEVVQQLSPRPAYTTAMTILVRLHNKGWLERRKVNRKYVYWAKYTSTDWQRAFASDAIARFLATPFASRALLASALWDGISQHDPALLMEIERQIQRKRNEEEYANVVRREI